MNLDDNIFEDFDGMEESDEEPGQFEQLLLDHLFHMRLSIGTNSNFQVLKDRANDETLTAEEREEARKWLHKMGSEVVDQFRNNIFISVMINGRKICNLSIREQDELEVITDMAVNVPPIRKIVNQGTIKDFEYEPLTSLNIILEAGDDE